MLKHYFNKTEQSRENSREVFSTFDVGVRFLSASFLSLSCFSKYEVENQSIGLPLKDHFHVKSFPPPISVLDNVPE